jgi:hypothetical protein
LEGLSENSHASWKFPFDFTDEITDKNINI